MTQSQTPNEIALKRKSKPILILGLTAALGLGSAGFWVSYTRLLPGLPESASPVPHGTPEALPDVAFVGVAPITISLAPGSSARHLRFAAQLEVATPHVAEVSLLLPRIADVLNSYLRAVELSNLEQPSSLVQLKAQMLRRIQIVTGEGRVRDLLISEFVMN